MSRRLGIDSMLNPQRTTLTGKKRFHEQFNLGSAGSKNEESGNRLIHEHYLQLEQDLYLDKKKELKEGKEENISGKNLVEDKNEQNKRNQIEEINQILTIQNKQLSQFDLTQIPSSFTNTKIQEQIPKEYFFILYFINSCLVKMRFRI